MEYVTGGNLHEKSRLMKIRGMKLTDVEILTIFNQLSSALQHMNKHHILHRDIKPENVFVTAEGQIKLGDFGTSKKLEHTMAVAKTV
jgi:serine/threonine protein kinase